MHLTDQERQLVAHYMFCKGHAQVMVLDDRILYLDRTPGFQVARKTCDIGEVLEKVKGLTPYTIQGMFDYERGVATEASEFYRRKHCLPGIRRAAFWNSNLLDFELKEEAND
jgi:hypothetical protein